MMPKRFQALGVPESARPHVLLAALLLFPGHTTATAGGAEAFEVGLRETAELPGGKEADGIRGDFVLRNDRIEAVIAGALPGRKANMATNWRDETPGCLYDLCLRGSRNDQLTCFAPGDLEGPVSRVGLPDAAPGASGAVLVERTAATGSGRAVVHRYVLRPGWNHLLVVSTYSNQGEGPWDVRPAPAVKGLSGLGSFAGVSFGDAMDPMDRQGYAWAPVALEEDSGAAEPAGSPPRSWDPVRLAPGETVTSVAALAPGISPADAFGRIARLRGPTGGLHARLREAGGSGAAPRTATMRIRDAGGAQIPAYPDGAGEISLRLPPGKYSYSVTDLGRPEASGSFAIAVDEVATVDVPIRPASGIRFQVTDDSRGGRPSPCKVQLIGVGTTPTPNLGVGLRAHGCLNQYHSEVGSFAVPLPPGTYRTIITRGIEYSHFDRGVRIEPERWTTVAAVLRRIVDTTGHVSTDFHSHSTPSGDNHCGTEDRIINFASENVEFAPTTEHNRLDDWGPVIAKLGLQDEVSTIVGIELTGDGAHLNAFPFRVEPWTQDNGAPRWQADPRESAAVLRSWQGPDPDRWVQLNHPSVGELFRDRDADGTADGGFEGLDRRIDAAETWSEHILERRPWLALADPESDRTGYRENRTFAWLQMLNQGARIRCLAVSDAHSVLEDGVGGWRTYVPSSTDDPARIDPREVIRNAKAGRMTVTNGPFIEARLSDGTLPGGSTVAGGSVQLDVRVQCTDWIDIDRVQILVNGRQPGPLNFTRAASPEAFGDGAVKFQRRIEVPIREDSHIIVAAMGEGFNLAKGYGRSMHGGMRPCAFTNPMYVDCDGNGFRANGDTLDAPLPTGRRP